VINDVLPSPHLSEIQGPTVELAERSLQTNIQPWVAHTHTDGLVVRVEENPMDLQALASLPMGFDVEEVEVEEGHPYEHEEGDTEPGKVEGFPNPGEREEGQSPHEGEKPEREPGPTRLMAGKKDENQNCASNATPQ
jgi:hypothetical protein